MLCCLLLFVVCFFSSVGGYFSLAIKVSYRPVRRNITIWIGAVEIPLFIPLKELSSMGPCTRNKTFKKCGLIDYYNILLLHTLLLLLVLLLLYRSYSTTTTTTTTTTTMQISVFVKVSFPALLGLFRLLGLLVNMVIRVIRERERRERERFPSVIRVIQVIRVIS